MQEQILRRTATSLKLCTPHSNNLEKLTETILNEVHTRCIDYLKEYDYIGISKKAESEFKIRKNMIKN